MKESKKEFEERRESLMKLVKDLKENKKRAMAEEQREFEETGEIWD